MIHREGGQQLKRSRESKQDRFCLKRSCVQLHYMASDTTDRVCHMIRSPCTKLKGWTTILESADLMASHLQNPSPTQLRTHTKHR